LKQEIDFFLKSYFGVKRLEIVQAATLWTINGWGGGGQMDNFGGSLWAGGVSAALTLSQPLLRISDDAIDKTRLSSLDFCHCSDREIKQSAWLFLKGSREKGWSLWLHSLTAE
jgi:hypothetical protein